MAGWLNIRVSPEIVQTQRSSMKQARLRRRAGYQMRAGSARMPFQPSRVSRARVLENLIPSVAPNSTKKPPVRILVS